MNDSPVLCNCGCGRVVKHPNHKYIRGHVGKRNVQGRNDLLDAVCGFCNAPIKVERWRINRFGADNVYCSIQHAAAKRSQDAVAKMTCEQCGKAFSMKRSKKQGQHIFCSVKCAGVFQWKSNRPVATCTGCGITFPVSPSRLARSQNVYCSVGCRAQHIQGKNNPAYRSGTGRHPYYGGNWRKQRRLAIQRDNATCQHCGKKPKRARYLEVHHIQPAYLFGDDHDTGNSLDNLICLCVTCHKKAEKGIIAIQPRLI